jgi:hypothetical protein
VAYWVLAFGALKQLRVAARAEVAMDASKVFAAAIILCYWIELFVRGAGYFTGTSIMLVAAFRIWSLAPKAPPLGAIASLAVR